MLVARETGWLTREDRAVVDRELAPQLEALGWATSTRSAPFTRPVTEQCVSAALRRSARCNTGSMRTAVLLVVDMDSS